MASIIRSKNGTRAIQFTHADGVRRPTIRLGKIPERELAQIRGHVENLVDACIRNVAPPRATSLWLADLGESLHQKLERGDWSRLARPRRK